LPSLRFSLRIIKNIIPIFIVIFALMVALDYLVSPENVRRYLGKSAGLKRWLIAVAGGIISTGPIYMWYPMLRQLRKKGVKYGFIATFLYNRAVKPPLIPMIILYFGLRWPFMRIAIASDGKDENAKVSKVSGRAPYYLIFEDGKLTKAIKNPFRIGGGGAGFGVAEMLSDEKVEIVISGKFGTNEHGKCPKI